MNATPPYNTQAQGAPTLQGRSLRRLVIQILFLGVLAFSAPPLMLALGSYVYFHATDQVLPGVYLMDEDLGWKTVAQVEQLIAEKWNQDDEISVVDLHDPTRTWSDNAASFGLAIDANATAMQAYSMGREGTGFESVLNLFETLRMGAAVDAVMTLDVVLAKKHLEHWAQRAAIPATDDHLSFDGHEILMTEASDGKAVDVLSSLDMLIQDPNAIRLEHKMIPLVMASVPANRYEMQHAENRLGQLLAAEISLNAYDPVTDEQFRWAPTSDEFERWFEIYLRGDAFEVAFLPTEAKAYLEDINRALGEERRLNVEQALSVLQAQLSGSGQPLETLMVEYSPGAYRVQAADNLVGISFKIGMPYWKLYETNPDLATQGLEVGETLVVPPRDDMLALPVVPDKRIVISILDQRMWVYGHHELIAEHVISTGIPSSPTLPGIFQVNSHFENAYASIWDLTMPHFMGIYDAVPGLTNGIHGLPLLSSGRRLWADVLGNPASYGCIILDLQAAEELFYWAEEGVVVEIRE